MTALPTDITLPEMDGSLLRQHAPGLPLESPAIDGVALDSAARDAPAPASTALDLWEPTNQKLPLVLASGHSGCDYTPDFLAASRLDPLALRRSEDSFVDEIFAQGPALGAPLLAARFPRAYLDVNREAWELDPSMFADTLPSFVNASSSRVRMGLGTVARVVASGEEIYARKLRFSEARQRVEDLYRPYHRQLRRLVEQTERRFGGYLLIDCHSMPSVAGGHDTPDIVLGDCHGAACAPQIIDEARRFLAAQGFVVAVNVPYAGGFTTDHYGRPLLSRHALQIEINRALYMDEQSYRRNKFFAQLATSMAAFVEHLGGVIAVRLAEGA